MQEFKLRRKQLIKSMGKNSVAILVAAKQLARNADYDYPYRQNSDFYYLTGFCEPEALAVFVPGRAEGEYILFNRTPDKLASTWTGDLIGQRRAVTEYGANQSFPVEQAYQMLPELMANKKRLYFGGAVDDDFMIKLRHLLQTVNNKKRQGKNAPEELVTVSSILHEMRIRKSRTEMALIKKAAAIGTAAHMRAMRACRPGMFEYEIEAELVHEYIRSNTTGRAFQTIVAGGANGCVLHYTSNRQQLKDGELLLIDAGVEYKYYGSDITRTIPINGRFTAEQRAIYQAVLDVQKAVIAAVKPGITWQELHQFSEKLIIAKLVALRLLKGKVNDLLARQAHKPFYMHFISHFIGLDNHDAGKYKTENSWRKLEPGMVLSVEPGLYINAKIPGVNKKWHGIAVRIEDMVLVTKKGCEVLTAQVPKEIADIEKLML